MGRKGGDGFGDTRKPRGPKKPVRKFNDQKTTKIRGYKEVKYIAMS